MCSSPPRRRDRDVSPSREAALALAEALGVQGEGMNAWLVAAGYAPMPLLPRVRGAIRTRGRGRSPSPPTGPSSVWNAARWAQWLEAIGLQEATIAHLLRALETAGPQERQTITQAVSTTFTRLIEGLEAPVRTAVIPAAGGQHRLFAQYVMQHLLLRAIREAVESGISLQPSIFGPLRPLREQGKRPVHLTEALDHLRQSGEGVYAFALEAARADLGEVLGRRANALEMHWMRHRQPDPEGPSQPPHQPFFAVRPQRGHGAYRL